VKNNIRSWIALARIPGITPSRFKFLIDAFDNPEGVLHASFNTLKLAGIKDDLINRIITNKEKALLASEQDVSYINNNNIKVFTWDSPEYPELLKEIHSPPPVLYCAGNIVNEDKYSLAIVGSRNTSSYGLQVTKMLAGELSQSGLTIVSGMARGIDSIAHTAALEQGGRTIAVLGSGIDVIYPPENKPLYERIVQQCAVISEFPIGTPPLPHNFPVRNRLVSGLSLGVLVIEAREKSGALITADYALQQNREVFAVPGNMTSLSSRGSNRLIRDGAKMIETSQDVLVELLPKLPVNRNMDVTSTHERDIEKNDILPNHLSELERNILLALNEGPLHIDILAEKLDKYPHELAQPLLKLELTLLVRQNPGKSYEKLI